MCFRVNPKSALFQRRIWSRSMLTNRRWINVDITLTDVATLFQHISTLNQRWVFTGFHPKQFSKIKVPKIYFLNFLRFVDFRERKIIYRDKKSQFFLLGWYMVTRYYFFNCFQYYFIMLISLRFVLDSITDNTNKTVSEIKELIQTFL